MENVLKYYEFSSFFKDESGAFSGNEISYTELNDTHFLIFEENNTNYNLYVSKFKNKNEIGHQVPEILELLIVNYDKSIPEHRIAIKQYLD
ncbi:hypothetical protein H9W90_00925 [Polaribacter pectinis]|uniref:Uncharacterized protein n=1 Tax=Polaribacter pectinis TaxID=2738844 RepID=A0A7G9LAS0_9FLAO|nr:hypothetical protein [Polaribacter pectinis]QNM85719.1 hypothetical protein H9W90_00925 [Polaribacter pectinis]